MRVNSEPVFAAHKNSFRPSKAERISRAPQQAHAYAMTPSKIHLSFWQHFRGVVNQGLSVPPTTFLTDWTSVDPTIPTGRGSRLSRRFWLPMIHPTRRMTAVPRTQAPTTPTECGVRVSYRYGSLQTSPIRGVTVVPTTEQQVEAVMPQKHRRGTN